MLREALLIALRLKGYARLPALVETLRADPLQIETALADLTTTGLAETTKIGTKLTPAGQVAADAVHAAERLAAAPQQLEALYDRFEHLNGPFKALVSRWQIRTVDGAQVPNDHSDAAYDAALFAELSVIDDDMKVVMAQLATLVPRAAPYGPRFTAALEKLLAGEHRYMAAPILDSYHTVWFELHEDLIRLTGRTRAAEAAAGRAL
jgi:hypothetical protein